MFWPRLRRAMVAQQSFLVIIIAEMTNAMNSVVFWSALGLVEHDAKLDQDDQ